MASETLGEEITLTEGLRDSERQAVPVLNYILASVLKLRKSTKT